MENLLILGAGGFGQMIAELAAESKQYDRIAFLDDNSNHRMVVGRLEDYPRFVKSYRHALVAMGNNPLRLEYIDKLEQAGYTVPVFSFRPAFVSPSAQIGAGSFVLPGAMVNTGAVVGKGGLINCGAIVDHNAVVEEGVHVCLNAVVKAGCRVKACTKIEAGQVVERP